MWAAYRDPYYEGGSIGEYQYYDWTTDTWDDSTCQGQQGDGEDGNNNSTGTRCAQLDCHDDENTQLQLVGVFKEVNGLEEWAEQLFKHQGYCLWNGDNDDASGDNGNGVYYGDYDFMQDKYSDDWMYYALDCQALKLTDSSGNRLYSAAMPQAAGNFDYGVYTDSSCSQLATNMTWSQYIIAYYASQNAGNYYFNRYSNQSSQNSNHDGYTQAQYHEEDATRWNFLMNDYKVCQPCRAYNKESDGDYGYNNGNNNGNNGDDGEGGAEQWGFNCYDDAGYRNCNQCWKFMSKTELEPATASDLARASAQGTILSINYFGTVYGEGDVTSLINDYFDVDDTEYHAGPKNIYRFSSHHLLLQTVIISILVVMAGIAILSYNWNRIKTFCQQRQFNFNVRDKLIDNNDENDRNDKVKNDDDVDNFQDEEIFNNETAPVAACMGISQSTDLQEETKPQDKIVKDSKTHNRKQTRRPVIITGN